MSETRQPSQVSATGARKRFLVLASLVVALVVGGWGYYRYKYPHGNTHACSKGLGLALRMYSGDHHRWLPYGESTPEASLGLLAKDDLNNALWTLGGKTVPWPIVYAALTNRGAFGPETCGWHYVEGLHEDDDPQIAVVWDKVVGLGHHGERRRGLMHEVVLLDGSTQWIRKARWPDFVAEQEKLLAKVIASRDSNAPPIRWSDEATLGPNRFPPPARQ